MGRINGYYHDQCAGVIDSMPTYEYQCKSCNHRFEIWQKMSDNPLTVCPECNGTIRRILFPAGIVFKGSGFYKTDHGNGTVTGENSQKSEQKDAAAKTEGSGETKAAGETKTSTEKTAAPSSSSESKVSAAAD